MDIKTMTAEELIERRAQIAEAIDAPEADLDALEAEVRSINDEIETRKAEEAAKAEIREQIASGSGETKETFEEEKKTMNITEIRSSAEYAEAYKKFIMSGDDTECRNLLTVQAPQAAVGTKTVPVPTVLEEGIKTAWESNEILSRVNRTYIRGNLRVAFELSATEAAEHGEGLAAPAEEELTIGVVELVAKNVKKWIKISDEAAAMGGPEFIRYITDEIMYQIAKKEAALVIADIVAAPATSDADSIGVPVVEAAPGVVTLPTAATQLSENATDLVVILNRLTEGDFLAAQAAASFAMDPFAGMTKVYTSALPAYSAATSGQTYAIVGDLKGEQINFPEGDDIVVKVDDLSLAELDLIKVVGRRYEGHGVTRPGMFVKVAKA